MPGDTELRGDGRRVYAPAQSQRHGHVGAEAKPHGIGDQGAHFANAIDLAARRKRRGLLGKPPSLRLRCALAWPRMKAQKMSRRKLMA